MRYLRTLLIRTVQSFINLGKPRIVSDGGTIEAENCTHATLFPMRSSIEKASLIITPLAHKESKLYAIKPVTGNGDLTWTRASNGTRINKDGFIERTPYNLVTNSEQFNLWSFFNPSTITENYAIAPNGTLTADLHTNIFGNAGGRRFSYTLSNPKIGTQYTASIYCKKSPNVNTANSLFIAARFNGGVNTLSQVTYNPVVTNDWVRYVYTFSVDYADRTVLELVFGNATTTAGLELLFWGAQLVEGSTPKDYFPTTDRLNVPRINYPTTGGTPSILIEPQRTNLLTYSEQFDQSGWGKTNASVSANKITSPSGILNADKIVENSLLARHEVYRNLFGLATGTTYTFSIYLRSGERGFAKMAASIPGGTGLKDTTVNLSTGVVTSGGGISSQNVNNGWFRYYFNFTTGTGTTGTLYIGVDNDSLADSLYQGDGVSGMYVWGAQLEVGAYPTSYIPTTSATVTRNLDRGNRLNIASLLSSSGGSLYVESRALENDLTQRMIAQISDGTDNNAITIQYSNLSNTIRFQVLSGGANRNVHIPVDNIKLFKKLLITWKSGEYFGYINGVKHSIGNGTGVPTGLNQINLETWWGGVNFNGELKSIALFPSPISDTEAIQLTTL